MIYAGDEDMMYESKISTGRWMAYDVLGNAGWIAWIVCLVLLFKNGVDAFTILAALPALVMLIGIAELISERVQKLDWVLPKTRLYRGFGALTLGGIMGILVSTAGLLSGKVSSLAWFMLAGSSLCALFAWLLFREYKPRDRDERSELHDHT